jgi:hypothetical protein
MRPRLRSRAAVAAAGAAETRTSPVEPSEVARPPSLTFILRPGGARRLGRPPHGVGSHPAAGPSSTARRSSPGARGPPPVTPPHGAACTGCGPTVMPARSLQNDAIGTAAARTTEHQGGVPSESKLATRCRRQPASRRCREDPLRDGREPLRAQATAATGWRGRVTSWRGSRGPGQRGHGRTSRSGVGEQQPQASPGVPDVEPAYWRDGEPRVGWTVCRLPSRGLPEVSWPPGSVPEVAVTAAGSMGGRNSLGELL